MCVSEMLFCCLLYCPAYDQTLVFLYDKAKASENQHFSTHVLIKVVYIFLVFYIVQTFTNQ